MAQKGWEGQKEVKKQVERAGRSDSRAGRMVMFDGIWRDEGMEGMEVPERVVAAVSVTVVVVEGFMLVWFAFGVDSLVYCSVRQRFLKTSDGLLKSVMVVIAFMFDSLPSRYSIEDTSVSCFDVVVLSAYKHRTKARATMRSTDQARVVNTTSARSPHVFVLIAPSFIRPIVPNG